MRCRLPVIAEDPFISTLRNIVSDESSRKVHIGDKYSSRDSYINSQTTRKDRWWRSQTRYSVVNTVEPSPFSVCNKHSYKRIPFTRTSYQTITISVNCK